jgi:protein O-mannosyl-transferase
MLETYSPPGSYSPPAESPVNDARPQPQRHALLVAIGAAVLVFVAAYANSWRSSFHFDDAHVVETNPAIRSLANIPRFFTDARTFSSLPSNQTYRPVVTLSLAIDHAVAQAATGNGLDPRSYHLTQLLLLALVAALVGGVARHVYLAASRDDPELATWVPWTAVAAAALFAVHIGNTEVGNYVSARSESLSAAGVLGGLLLYMRGGTWRRAHLYLLPMALGALSKTPAVLLAPLLLLWCVSDEDAVNLATLRTACVRAVPAFLAAVALYVFVEGMNPPEQSYGGGSLLQNLWTQAWVSVRYAGLFFIPNSLSADSDWTALPSPLDVRVLAGLALIAFSGWAVWRSAQARMTRPIGFGIVWFWIGLVPGIAVPLAEVTNDHRPFLSYAGLTMAVVWGGALLVRRMADSVQARNVALLLASLVLAVHAAGTHARNRVWISEASLWADVARTSPGNARGLMNLALTNMRQARYVEARALLDSAARLAPTYPLIYVNMAIAADAQGDTATAAASFRRAISIDPRSAEARRYYARWLAAHGGGQNALVEYERAISARPADVNARRERLLLLEAKGSRADAMREARTILSFDAGDSVAQAIAGGQPSVAPAPDSSQVRTLTDRWYQAGWALTRAGRHAEAIQAYREAVSADSSNADALNNLGWSLGVLGFFDLAVPTLERAVAVAPRGTLERNNLAWGRAMLAHANPAVITAR